jgi:hypothetical protein
MSMADTLRGDRRPVDQFILRPGDKDDDGTPKVM